MLSDRSAENNFVSSAYMDIMDWSCEGISLTYKMYKMGPRMLPWGIPDITGFQLEVLSFTLQLLGNALIQFKTLPLIPKYSALKRRL
mgnify:CR=1 FL=1